MKGNFYIQSFHSNYPDDYWRRYPRRQWNYLAVLLLAMMMLMTAEVYAEAEPKAPLEWDLTAIIYCDVRIDVPACGSYISFMGAVTNRRHNYYLNGMIEERPVALIRGVKHEDVDTRFNLLLERTKEYVPSHVNNTFHCFYDSNRAEDEFVEDTWLVTSGEGYSAAYYEREAFLPYFCYGIYVEVPKVFNFEVERVISKCPDHYKADPVLGATCIDNGEPNIPPKINNLPPSLIIVTEGVDTNAVDNTGNPLGRGTWTLDLNAVDPDKFPDDPLTYSLQDAPSFVNLSPNGVLSIDVPIGTGGGYHSGITIDVYDGRDTTSATFDVQVEPNLPPVAIVEPVGDFRVEVGKPLDLDASQSSDPEHQPLTYQWVPITNGPSLDNISFTGEKTAKPTFTSNVTGSFGAIFEVWDPYQKSNRIAINIHVVDYDPERNEGAQCTENNGSNPINGATGNKVQREMDYTGAGPFPLSFGRVYNSFLTAHASKTSLGYYWRGSYDRRVMLDIDHNPVQAQVHRADGNVIIFDQVGNQWQARPGVLTRLVSEGNGWAYTTLDDAVERYDSSGRLVSITTREGFRHTLSYVGNQLTAVNDGFGRSLVFGYDSEGRLASLTDPADKLITYDYDELGNLRTVVYPVPDVSFRIYSYDNPDFPHALTGISDGGGVNPFATFTYDDQGRATSSSHAQGAVDTVSFIYNADGTTKITDAKGEVRTYSYTNENGVVKVGTINGSACSVCGGLSQNNTYDANGYPDRVTDFNGNVTDYDYNDRGLIEQRIDAVGTPEERTFSTVWHPTYRLPVCQIGPTRTTALVYSTIHQLKTRTVYDTSDATLFTTAASKTCDAIAARGDIATLKKRIWSYAYYPQTLLTKSVDGPRTDVNDITTFFYDETSGNLSEVHNAFDHVTTYSQYDGHGRPGQIVDPNGLTTLLTYNGRGRLSSLDAGGEVTAYKYNAGDNLARVTLANGAYLDYTYDGARRLTDITDQLGNYIHYTLDALGNRTQTEVFDPENNLQRTQTMQFDQQNRLEKIIGTANQTTEYVDYDANGNLKQLKDPAQHDTFFDYDALNRLTTITDPLNGVTTHTYDANNNLTSIEDPRGLVTSYTYDGFGNLTQVDSPDTGITDYTEYDEAGNLKHMTDARGVETLMTYDALNRIKTLTHTDGTDNTVYIYTYDDVETHGKGRLHTISGDQGTITYAYDTHGRIIRKAETHNDDHITLTVTYQYDDQGLLERMTTPGGWEVTYLYSNGQLNEIRANNNPVISNLLFDPFGPPSSWTWGNGASAFRDYDADGQLVNYSLGSGSRTLSYYPTGQLQDIIDPGNSANNQSFGYDELLRLHDYTATGQHEVYDYDANGNRTTLTQGTTTPVTYDTVIDPLSNRLQSSVGPTPKTYGYDAIGNPVSDGTTGFDYDLRGRLTQVSQQTNSVNYVVNALGERISKQGSQAGQGGDFNGDGHIDGNDVTAIKDLILSGDITAGEVDCIQDNKLDVLDAICLNNQLATSGSSDQPYSAQVRFAYDAQGNLLGEYDANFKPLRELVWFGGRPIAVLQGAERYYVHTDHLNTPRVITNQANTEVWRWPSDPFGNAQPEEDPDGDGANFVFNLRFPGQYYDQETGLHYNYFRDYDPTTGRYIQSDPIGLAGGLNTYAYVNGNPVNAGDVNGLITREEYYLKYRNALLPTYEGVDVNYSEGNVVNINAAVRFTGSGATQENINIVLNSINYWLTSSNHRNRNNNGKFGDYNVQTTLTCTDDAAITINIDDKYFQDEHYDYFERTINISPTKESLTHASRHEFGHVLGLIDKYAETQLPGQVRDTAPIPGFVGNLMAQTNGRLFGRDIRTILLNYGALP